MNKKTDNKILSEAVAMIAEANVKDSHVMDYDAPIEYAALIEASQRITELDKENYMLRNALHDAIRKPMGVVPHSAENYYEPERWYNE